MSASAETRPVSRAVARKDFDQLPEEELLRLAVTMPPAPSGETPEQQVERFLRFQGIRPGRSAAVELHLVYALYLDWLREHAIASPSGAPRLELIPSQIAPQKFGRLLSAAGFRRKRAWRRHDARPCLSTDQTSAVRLKAWARTVNRPELRHLCQCRRWDSPPHAPDMTAI